MTRLITILCLLVWNLLQLNAQSHVVASGANIVGSNGSLSYSAGQIDYITVRGQGGVLTEGVQQPFVIQLIAGIENDGIALDAVVYPNPASSYVELKINTPVDRQLNYKLIDMNGRVLAHDRVNESITDINMSELSSGIYYLVIMENKEIIKTYQISATK